MLRCRRPLRTPDFPAISHFHSQISLTPHISPPRCTLNTVPGGTISLGLKFNFVIGLSPLANKIIRLAPDADAPPAFRRRCLFVKAAQAQQTVRSAGMIGTTTRE